MRHAHTKMNRRRPNDFPEHQVGYPERNDVSNPDNEMERIHVDGKRGLSRKSAAQVMRELREKKVAS